MKKAMILLILTIILQSTSVATAQPGGDYELTWWTVDSGGGSEYGGNYRLNGTAGQPDTGVLTGGDYIMFGGFWGGETTAPSPSGGATYLPVILKNTK